VVTERLAAALLDRGLHSAWVEDRWADGLEAHGLLPEAVRTDAAAAIARATAATTAAAARGRRVERPVVAELAAVAARLVDHVGEGGPSLALHDLAPAGEYGVRHPVDVAALGLLLGRDLLERRRDEIERRLRRLALGLLLHDLGKAALAHRVTSPPGAPSPADAALLRAHPQAAAAILPEDTSPVALAVVRQHHERWDGSGRPTGRAGTEIHELARIAAVADVFDAVTSEHLGEGGRPQHAGVAMIAAGRGTRFDPAVVDAFLRLVPAHPVGTAFVCADGRAGVVCGAADGDLARPLVRVAAPGGGWETVEAAGTAAEAAAAPRPLATAR
jgi:HD-GYP domain-containing protein (c-di-GMP phosphodiesterase class II)